MSNEAPAGLSGTLRTWLRVEGLAVFAATLALYVHDGGSLWLFVLLFLAPDLSMLAYLGGPVVGALGYNLVHTYSAPAVLATVGVAGLPWALPLALIWAAHIGFDRALGYGLKHRAGFGFTHLGRIGREARAVPEAG